MPSVALGTKLIVFDPAYDAYDRPYTRRAKAIHIALQLPHFILIGIVVQEKRFRRALA